MFINICVTGAQGGMGMKQLAPCLVKIADMTDMAPYQVDLQLNNGTLSGGVSREPSLTGSLRLQVFVYSRQYAPRHLSLSSIVAELYSDQQRTMYIYCKLEKKPN